ncbi:MAG: oligosaccharide flippase family protein [Pseudomonadota bacterium]
MAANFLARFGERLFPDGSLKGIITLSGGSIIGHVVLAASSPLISRLYAPEEFGLFSIFFSIFGITSIISTLQYHNAIPVPREDRSGAEVFVAAVVILGGFSLLSFGVLALAIDWIADLAQMNAYQSLLWLLPAAIVAANFNLCLQFWFLRKKEYHNLAIVKGAQSVTMALGQIGLGLAKLGAIGLIVGHIVGQATGIVQLLWGVRRRYREPFGAVRGQGVVDALRTHRSYATMFTPAAILGASTVYLPAIALGVLYGPAAAGAFAFGLQLSKAGMSILVQSVSKVFLVNAIDDFNEENRPAIMRRALKFCFSQFLIGLPIFLPLVFFGEEIFGFLFGDNWAIAGKYVALLTPHLYTFFVFDHLVNLFIVTGKHQWKLIWDGLKFLVLVAIFVLGQLTDLPADQAILFLSIGWASLHLALTPIARRLLR